MARIVAGALIRAGECGEDDVTAANLEQMADTLEIRPPTDEDRRELVSILRWLAGIVREMETSDPSDSTTSRPAVDESDAEERRAQSHRD